MKRRNATIATVLALTGVWVVGLGCYPLVRWSLLNCRHEEIDINSGRIRRQRFLVGLCINAQIEESPLSLALSHVVAKPDWRRVNTFSPFVRQSPHYRFHSSIQQTRQLQVIWRLAEFTPEARQESCQRVLELWQSEQNDSAADDYLDALARLAMNRDSDAPPVTVAELVVE
ncbi:hypothetical protein GC176_23760 [bacterium]|nr:hypothetical protein [bacterium]